MTPETEEIAALGAALKQLALASTGLKPDDIAGEIVDAARHLGGTDVVVLVADLDEDVLRPLDPAHGHEEHDVEGPGPGEAFRTEQAVAEAPEGGRRRLWVPLLDSAERIGVLGVVDDGRIDTSSWRAIASLAGEMIVSKSSYGDALVLRRRRREASLAAEMRWGLLPSLTYTSTDVSISGVVRPSYGIAGDAFDYGLDGSRASVAVLDAMGHGLEASRMANLAISSYRTTRRSGLAPTESIAAMDAVIAEEFGESRFVTAQVLALDTGSGRLEIANAGHPPPVLLRGEGWRTIDCPPGRPAGLGVGHPVPRFVDLEPGDAVLLQTDGGADARSPRGAPFGDDRLADVVVAGLAAGLPAGEVLRQAARAVVDHQGGRLGDDITLVLLRWPGDRAERS